MLLVVHLLFVHVFLIIGVVYVVVVRNISIVWISASTGNGSGSGRQMNLTSCVVVVSIIVYGWHRSVKVRMTRCLMSGIGLIICGHNRVVDDAALLITVITIMGCGGTAVFYRGDIEVIIINRQDRQCGLGLRFSNNLALLVLEV